MIAWIERGFLGAIPVVIFYLLLASLVFFLTVYAFPRWYLRHRIQNRDWQAADIFREIFVSIISIVTGSLLLQVPYSAFFKAHSLVYQDPGYYCFVYIPFSFLLLLFLHDTNFYFFHRLLHRPFFFKTVHYLHHRSTHPSIFAASSFHTIETIFLTFWIIPITFLIPLNATMLSFTTILIYLHTFFFHYGVELLPRRFRSNKIGGWINTTTNHDLHHLELQSNFGSFLIFWDWCFRTLKSPKKSGAA